MPTHFPRGITNVSKDTLAGAFPAPWRPAVIEYFNDFMTYSAGDWTITTTEAGAGDATEALSSSAGAAGGWLVVTNDAADDDNDFFQLVGEAFRWSSTTPMWFGARFKVSDATQSDVVFGLQITDTSPLDVTDGFTFIKADGSTTMNFLVEKNNTATTTAAGTLADNTFVTVGFFYNPLDGLFHIFWNDVEVATSVATNAVDDEDLTVSFGIQNGEAVAKVLTVDWIWAAQARNDFSWS